MGLSAEIELDLRDAGLIDFFAENRQAFKEIAVTTLTHTVTYVAPTGMLTRPDDVAKGMVMALETNQTLRTFLQTNHLPQKYQYRRFADLIIDRLWEEIHNVTTTEA